MHFDKISFMCQWEKEDKKRLRDSDFALLWVVFKWHHGSEGVNVEVNVISVERGKEAWLRPFCWGFLTCLVPLQVHGGCSRPWQTGSLPQWAAQPPRQAAAAGHPHPGSGQQTWSGWGAGREGPHWENVSGSFQAGSLQWCIDQGLKWPRLICSFVLRLAACCERMMLCQCHCRLLSLRWK